MGMIRSPAVAGAFYPARPLDLAESVRALLVAAPHGGASWPKAIIAPHAGYIYSGPTAAAVYARLMPARGTVSRVVLLGPSHHVAFRGIATSSADAFATPLGAITLDKAAVARLKSLSFVGLLDGAHTQEHSLEVHLPFLQTVLGPFALVPLVVGQASPDQVAAVIETLWGGPETVIVISSDLSHYLGYEQAQASDARARDAIEHLDAAALTPDQACGRLPIAGLLLAATHHGLVAETVDVRNSGDTAGPRDRVVGYGAWAFAPRAPAQPSAGAGDGTEIRDLAPQLLAIARGAIEGQLRDGRPGALPEAMPPRLESRGAAFVTLKRGDELRGCIGSPMAWRPLGLDIRDNALRAAFGDPRFPPVSAAEWPELSVSVSVLTPPQPLHFADESDLLAQLRPGIDGLIIEDGGRRALFLPAVWESLPEKRAFLAHLKLKAGLAADHWSPTFKADRFEAVEVK